MKNWFTAKNLPELKKQYKELAKQFHPDMGGSDEAMAQINSEYDRLSKILPNISMNGEEYEPKERENARAWRDCIANIIHCEGLEIEICGTWVWVTGSTIIHKETLKANGYKWSAKKVAWYWHDEGYRKLGHKTYNLDDIRGMWGSEKIETEKVEKFA